MSTQGTHIRCIVDVFRKEGTGFIKAIKKGAIKVDQHSDGKGQITCHNSSGCLLLNIAIPINMVVMKAGKNNIAFGKVPSTLHTNGRQQPIPTLWVVRFKHLVEADYFEHLLKHYASNGAGGDNDDEDKENVVGDYAESQNILEGVVPRNYEYALFHKCIGDNDTNDLLQAIQESDLSEDESDVSEGSDNECSVGEGNMSALDYYR